MVTAPPQVVQLLWDSFGRAEIDLCVIRECAENKATAGPADSYFPWLPHVIKRIREDKCPVLLVAPLWRNGLVPGADAGSQHGPMAYPSEDGSNI